jgi:hypothetical protein
MQVCKNYIGVVFETVENTVAMMCIDIDVGDSF